MLFPLCSFFPSLPSLNARGLCLLFAIKFLPVLGFSLSHSQRFRYYWRKPIFFWLRGTELVVKQWVFFIFCPFFFFSFLLLWAGGVCVRARVLTDWRVRLRIVKFLIVNVDAWAIMRWVSGFFFFFVDKSDYFCCGFGFFFDDHRVWLLGEKKVRASVLACLYMYICDLREWL